MCTNLSQKCRKQSFTDFKLGVLKTFVNLTVKHLLESLFNEVD